MSAQGSTISSHFVKRVDEDRSFGELLGRLATDSSTLVRNELLLAKKELGEKAAMGGKAGALLLSAGLLGLASLIFFGMTLLEVLALVLPRWGAALIIALGFVIIAGVFAAVGIDRLKRMSLKPEQTMETIEEDKEWLKKLA
ncbi:MAG TPA: phage holin family protein [Blastocatellia bacterium]|nr:phage holin family protein [Blastocatellia bacterium]